MILLSEYQAEVRKRSEAEVASLARGAARTYDEYQKIIGRIQGLALALDILKEVVAPKPKEERT
jgi:hypothetical protein